MQQMPVLQLIGTPEFTMSNDRQKTFVLGVGAEKTGTTWLHTQLEKYEEFDKGFAKEYHIFDVLHISCGGKFQAEAAQKFRRLLKKDIAKALRHSSFKRLSFYADTNSYFDYFAGLLEQDDCRLTADITPSYSGLPEDVLRSIKDGFNSRGIDVKVVFLMREPINRLSSSVRMNFRKNERKINNSTVLAAMKQRLGKDSHIIRDNYVNTYNNLVKVFAEHERFIGFYETIFSSSEIERLRQFLNLATNEFDTSQKVNVTRQKIQIPAPEIESFKTYFADRYEFVRDNFDPGIYSAWMKEIEKVTEGN